MELFENGVLVYQCKRLKTMTFGFGCTGDLTEWRAFPGAEKATLALLGLISSNIAVYQQTCLLLDLRNRHDYQLQQRLALTLGSSKRIRGTHISRSDRRYHG